MKLMPQEIEVRYILPAIRKQLTIALAKNGLKQNQIAKLLNITPAAVSQYTKEKRGTTSFPKIVQKEINNSTKLILENKSTPHKELYKISNLIKETATICDIHRLYDNVPKTCEVCFPK
jgi:predicted transcriptional regulator